jgi:hypothetical protein
MQVAQGAARFVSVVPKHQKAILKCSYSEKIATSSFSTATCGWDRRAVVFFNPLAHPLH